MPYILYVVGEPHVIVAQSLTAPGSSSSVSAQMP